MTTGEYLRAKWGDRKIIELSAKMAELRDRINGAAKGTTPRDHYKSHIGKWFSDEHGIDSENLLLLSKILNVSIESILSGKDIDGCYTERATAYSAAYSGDESIIDRLFCNNEITVEDKDEYGRSFIDYVIEFDNYRALKIAVSRGYDRFGKCLNLDPINDDTDLAITKMIVGNDDLEMFQQAFCRLNLNELSHHAVYAKTGLPREITEAILNSKRILEWLMQIAPLTENERRDLNYGKIMTLRYPDSDGYVLTVPSLAYGYSQMMYIAVSSGSNKSLSNLLNNALDYIDRLKEHVGEHISDLRLDDEGNLERFISLKNDRRCYCLAVVPYVPNCDEISDGALREKAEAINGFFDSLK